MTLRIERRHITHYEVPGGIAHVTWRLQRRQVPLTEAERADVLGVIRRDRGTRCSIHAGVIMDDHIHVLFRLNVGITAAKLVHGWKSISAHQLCRQGRTAPLWQAEYYLRWIASPRLIDICASYIRANPERKWPGIASYPWVLP